MHALTSLRWPRGIPALAAALLLAACASPPPATPGWQVESGGDALHVASGLRFPSEFKGLVRLDPHNYDPDGTNASIEYRRDDPLLVVTLYVYPREAGGIEPVDEFRGAVGAVLKLRSGAAVHIAKQGTIGKEPRRLDAFFAGLTWVESSGEVGSWLLLVSTERWFHKVRASCSATSRERVVEAFEVAVELLQYVQFGSS